ncbi:Hypothetical protein SRAE_1000038600 [Strongyloides ratti]|uniref:Uncharacterized protein n=1 Tax=Strongyloides ratti TaxID=34506 RepID=A0A090L1X4_STRRB|nr:Hypothetical protein SRAE_1000038600 [Strongyloides ratti]CEF62112.1 Hypothetical protein SRAE_1000038600 [Strongyloides ratti]
MIYLLLNRSIFFSCAIYFFINFLQVFCTSKISKNGPQLFNENDNNKLNKNLNSSFNKILSEKLFDNKTQPQLTNFVSKFNNDSYISNNSKPKREAINNTLNSTNATEVKPIDNRNITTSNDNNQNQPLEILDNFLNNISLIDSTNATTNENNTIISITTPITITSTTTMSDLITNTETISNDDTEMAILDTAKNEQVFVESLPQHAIEETTDYGKLNSDGTDFDYKSLINGVWSLTNLKKFSFTCKKEEVNSKYDDYYETIEVMKRNEMNEWVSIKRIEHKGPGKHSLTFKMGISNETMKNLNFKFLTFIGDFQCKYSYNKYEGDETSYELIKKTPILKIRFGAVTFLVETDIQFKKSIKLSCPMLEHVKMYRQSAMYFDDNTSNYIDGNYKRVIFTVLPKNAIRVENDTSIIIKNFKSINLGFYHCVYTDGTLNDIELRLVYKVFSSEFDTLQIDNMYLKLIFIYMSLTLGVLFLTLIFQ